MKKHILIVTVAYPPEIRSASHLMHDLAVDLHERGYKVSIVTPYPQYNLSREEQGNSYSEFSTENGIDIIRIKTPPVFKVNFVFRAMSQMLMPYLFFPKVKKYIKLKIDIVMVYSPPLFLSAVGWMTKKRYGAKFVLNVQDLFPQNAVDIGIVKNSFVRRFFECIERKAYNEADIITVHSEGNRNFLLNKKHVPAYKLHTLHNWIDISSYLNIKRSDEFRKSYGLSGKFIILFAGVIGPSQGLDLIVKAASHLREFNDICFLIVGDGTEKPKLEKMAADLNLKNIVFKQFVSKEKYPYLVKESDVGLVCLTNKNRTPVVPGKIMGYMAASIPVLAFINEESDAHNIIHDAGCGYSATSTDSGKVVDLVKKIYSEQERMPEMGRNGFDYVSMHFTLAVCIDKLENLFSFFDQ